MPTLTNRCRPYTCAGASSRVVRARLAAAPTAARVARLLQARATARGKGAA